MKRGTPRHSKMYDLAARLKEPLRSAVGIMEMLWHFAGRETPEGDIGRLTDQEIAAAVAWEKKPALLLEALSLSGWLKKHPTFGYLIHDWPQHCDHAVKKTLAYRQGCKESEIKFSPGYSEVPPENSPEKSKEKPPEAFPPLGAAPATAKAEEFKKSEIPLRARAYPPGFELDEHYSVFRSNFMRLGAAVVDPEDFLGSAWFEWRLLDSQQRQDAVESLPNLQRAIENGEVDPTFIKRPDKWLKSKEWKRPIIARKSRQERLMEKV